MKFRDHFRDSELIFIAEIGINHNGDPASAKSLVDAAAGAGAHAVKFQTFLPELMYSAYASSLLAEGREVRKDPAQIDFFRKLPKFMIWIWMFILKIKTSLFLPPIIIKVSI